MTNLTPEQRDRLHRRADRFDVWGFVLHMLSVYLIAAVLSVLVIRWIRWHVGG